MTEAEAMAIVEAWNLSERRYDLDGCIEDIMDGWDPRTSKDEILSRNEYQE
jgi:hypothetical protein